MPGEPHGAVPYRPDGGFGVVPGGFARALGEVPDGLPEGLSRGGGSLLRAARATGLAYGGRGAVASALSSAVSAEGGEDVGIEGVGLDDGVAGLFRRGRGPFLFLFLGRRRRLALTADGRDATKGRKGRRGLRFSLVLP
ncbi:MAG: hypothetical protein DRH12_15215, partial [Deltaproteobacteria bacterium]